MNVAPPAAGTAQESRAGPPRLRHLPARRLFHSVSAAVSDARLTGRLQPCQRCACAHRARLFASAAAIIAGAPLLVMVEGRVGESIGQMMALAATAPASGTCGSLRLPALSEAGAYREIGLDSILPNGVRKRSVYAWSN
jgi:hypothetical protein